MGKITKALEKAAERRSSSTVTVEKPSALKEGRMSDWAVVPSTSIDRRIVAHHEPKSAIAEHYRMVCSALKTQARNQKAQVIALTSSIHSEGKTISAINLATTLARSGKERVLLVDADLRKSAIAKYLGLDANSLGLADLIKGKSRLKKCVVRTAVNNLAILPAGRSRRDVAHLLDSSTFEDIMKILRREFDIILVDTPPVIILADFALIKNCIDGTILVVQANRTPRYLIDETSRVLKQMKAKVLGFMLTNFDAHYSRYHYYHYYHKYHQDGYAEENKEQVDAHA